MIVRIEYTSTAPTEDYIDLKDYGYEAETSWDDLTYEQQCEITDSLCEQYDVIAGGEELDFENNINYYEETYDKEELEQIINRNGTNRRF